MNNSERIEKSKKKNEVEKELAKLYSFQHLKAFLHLYYVGEPLANPHHTKKGPGRKHKQGH